MPVKNVAVLVGSLRAASYNRSMAHVLASSAPESLKLSIVEIGALVPFNQDFESGTTPAEYLTFRETVKAADAVLFLTPEYNRSIPGVLKNAVDVGSRPYGQSVFKGKPAAVMSVSLGATGGFGANHHLRQVLSYLDMPTLGQPEAYIGGAAGLFDEAGKLKSEATQKFVADFMTAFAGWIEKIAGN